MDTPLERYRAYLLLLARRHIGHGGRLEASDVVQQTLLAAHRQRGQFRGQTPAEEAAWLRRVLAGTLADAIRALGRGKRDISRERSVEAALDESSARLHDWLAAEQSSPSERTVRGEDFARLADALMALPDAQREAVTLRHLHGLPLAEIAARLGRGPAATAGLLKRGLARLRELLKDVDP
ncbi:MAG: sigma-70 family RNA polymerase sigma factor [Gemmataceae bacterium]